MSKEFGDFRGAPLGALKRRLQRLSLECRVDDHQDLQPSEGMLEALDSACQHLKPSKCRKSVLLSPEDAEAILKAKCLNIFKISKCTPADSVFMPYLKNMVEKDDAHSLSLVSSVIQSLTSTDQLVVLLRGRIAKGMSNVKLLKVVIEAVPSLSLAPFFDQLGAVLNSDNYPMGIDLLSQSKDFPSILELLIQTKNVRARTEVLVLLRDMKNDHIPADSQRLLFEAFKRESLEPNGEIIAHILASLACSESHASPELLKHLSESLKAPKIKPFVIKFIFFCAKLQPAFVNELRQLMAKELKSPTSELLMTLTAILRDGSGSGMAIRPGFFLNDQFVVTEGRCVLSLENQLILLEALSVIIATNVEGSAKAVCRLVELLLFGHNLVFQSAINGLNSFSPSVMAAILNRVDASRDVLAPSVGNRLRRLFYAVAYSKSLDESCKDSLFFMLLRPCFQSIVPDVSDIAAIVKRDIHFCHLVAHMSTEEIRASFRFLSYPLFEHEFCRWFEGLDRDISPEHLEIWATAESEIPVLSVPDPSAASAQQHKDKMQGTTRAKEASSLAIKKQLEKERAIREKISKDIVAKFEKALFVFSLFAACPDPVSPDRDVLSDLSEEFLRMATQTAYGRLVGRELFGLVKLAGRGRLLVCDGVRWADWILSNSPQYCEPYKRYRSAEDPLSVQRDVPNISSLLARHPHPLLVFLESYCQVAGGVESMRAVLLYIERHADDCISLTVRMLETICRIGTRIEALEEECRTAVGALAGKVTELGEADFTSLHDMIMSESSLESKLAVEFSRQLKDSILSSSEVMGRALFIVGISADPSNVDLSCLIRYLLRYRHLSKVISQAICGYIGKTNTLTEALHLFAKEYDELLSARTPEGPKERVMNIDLTLQDRTLIGRILCELNDKEILNDHLPSLLQYFSFLLDKALCDPSPVSDQVGRAFFESSRNLISSLPTQIGIELLSRIEQKLSGARPSELHASSLDRQDMYRTWLIVLMAMLSNSLSRDDARRASILRVLVQSLSTPSETVQMAVADGMASLLGPNDDFIELYNSLSRQLTEGKSMAERRGAAFGLGAIFKTNGLSCLFSHNFIEGTLIPALTSSSTPARQGGLFGIELAARYLEAGLFDPLLPRLLQHILVCYSDPKQEIREAAMDATSAIIASDLSVHAVKMILPTIFNPIDTQSGQWRSKVAALEWLGAMSGIKGRRSLAPYLPQIVPRLTSGLSDAHIQVQRAARESLLQYGRVLRNPEIQRLFPLLLSALADPPMHTAKCLDKIIETSFTHVVDGPSLALLEPMLIRALTDRVISSATSGSAFSPSQGGVTASVEIKRKAAQIIGNLGSIIDPLELIPCLPGLTSALMAALGDPVPEVRSVAARVLGVLSRLVDRKKTRVMLAIERSCIDAVVSPDPSTILGRIDRAGRAQAAAEIFAHSHGPSLTAKLLLCDQEEGGLRPQLPDYIAMEGYIRLIGYLPGAFTSQGQGEQLYEEAALGDFFSTLLLEMAPIDPEPATLVEGWREACERTLRLLISRYSLHDPVTIFTALIACISPLKNMAPRTRLLAWKLLLEEYLGRVFPPPDRQIVPNDDIPGSAAVMASECPTGQELMALLPLDSVHRLQAAAFLGRYDHYSAIRVIASGIWKSLSEHPVRVMSEILPSIIHLICNVTAGDDDATSGDSESPDSYGNAPSDLSDNYTRALEEVLERMADRICLPLMQHCLDAMASNSASPHGIIRIVCCVASCMAEGRIQLTKSQADSAMASALVVLNSALSPSSSKRVRRMAGEEMFPIISRLIGVEAILRGLTSGLQGLVAIKPEIVLPVVLPSLQTADADQYMSVVDQIEQITAGCSESLAPWSIDLLKLLILKGELDQLSELQYRLCERIIVHCLVDRENIVKFVGLVSSISSKAAIVQRLVGIFYQKKEKDFDYLLYPYICPEHYDTVLSRTLTPSALLTYLHELSPSSAQLFVTRCLIPVITSAFSNPSEKVVALEKLRIIDIGSLSSPTVASMVGAFIRMLSDRSHSNEALRVAIIAAIIDVLSVQHSSPLHQFIKPFHPQLQCVLVSCITDRAAVGALVLLKPLLSRPQLLQAELESIASSATESTTRKNKAKLVIEKCF